MKKMFCVLEDLSSLGGRLEHQRLCWTSALVELHRYQYMYSYMRQRSNQLSSEREQG